MRPDRTAGFQTGWISPRRAGCPHPAHAGPRNHRGRNISHPVPAACGHAALRRSPGVRQKSEACSGVHTLPVSVVGAHFICARTAPPGFKQAGFHLVGRGAHTPPMQAPGTTGAGTYRTRFRRHVGMPPYGVRRESGKNRKPARAAIQAAPTVRRTLLPYSIPSCPLTFSGGFAIM